MDIVALQVLIKESVLLTEQERTYWLSNIDKMTPEQYERLEEILTRAQKIPWNEHIEHYISILGISVQTA